MAEAKGAIIVFGSGLERRAGQVMPSFDSESRLTAGAQYWSQTGRRDFLMPTGGRVFSGHEPLAVYAQRYLIGLGIPENQILILDTPKNTVQEIDHVKAASRRLETPITAGISSEWHLVARRLCELNGYPFFGAEEILSGKPQYERVVATLREDVAVPDLIKSQSQRLKLVGNPVGRVIYNMLSEVTRNKRAVVNDVTGPSFHQLAGNNNV